VIAFIGSVFSPYYHWSGRKNPENHVALNVALYSADRHSWAMTERGQGDLRRTADTMTIGASSMCYTRRGLEILFDEMALPWPGQRLVPSGMSGRILIEPEIENGQSHELDPDGHHVWWPVFPHARISIECANLPGGGWQGEAYHDFNFGSRVLEEDFKSWDWARGTTAEGETTILYDAILRSGARRTLGLAFSGGHAPVDVSAPQRQRLPTGIWGVQAGIGCDPGTSPKLVRKLEDAPFYRRSLVSTRVNGRDVSMVHESLDCDRLANPLVRLMLPFRMPRRARR